LTDVKINGLIINMEGTTDVIGTKLRVVYGTFLIILGIVTALVTYKYIFPMGSIISVLSGLVLIFWNRWNYMIRDFMVKVVERRL
jgi:uncharacterized membrane protein